MPSSREWLLAHLREQVDLLSARVADVEADSAGHEALLGVRDDIFLIRETLNTLGVPLALADNQAWNRAIGTGS